MDTNARVAVVTGGGSGIGRATAMFLAEAGMRVVVAGRRQAPLDETAAMLRSTGTEALAVACDIRDAEQVARLFDASCERFGTVHALVNNAGGQFPAAALDLTPGGWNAVLSTNLTGTFYCCQALAKLAQGDGESRVIVNMTIPWYSRGCPGLSHAVAARAGVVALTKSLAIEWAPMNIRINCIAPGMVATRGLVDEEFGGEASGAEELLGAVPLGRAASAEEIAKIIGFMVSDTSEYMTGHTLVVDGGVMLGRGFDFLDHTKKKRPVSA